MQQFFYITIHFYPEYEGVVFIKQHADLYQRIENGELYRKRLLYDFGWGQEYGYELLPPLSFNKLIGLVEQPKPLMPRKKRHNSTVDQDQQANIWRSNLFGAVAVIMQDHAEELVEFLSTKVDTSYFFNTSIRENFKWFSFDSRKGEKGRIPGGVGTRSYEDILKEYPKWRDISQKICNQIYETREDD